MRTIAEGATLRMTTTAESHVPLAFVVTRELKCIPEMINQFNRTAHNERAVLA